MDTLYTLYIGGEFDRNGEHIHPAKAEAVLRDAMHFAVDKFGGGTMLLGWGAYLDRDGKRILERAARIEIVATRTSELTVYALAEEIQSRLNSESVLVTATPLTSVDFVVAKPEKAAA